MKTLNALELLEQQHEEVRKLLEEMTTTTPRAEKTRRRLLPQIDKKLRAHMRIEEEIFYPAYREATRNQKEEKLYYEALEEHHAAEHELNELLGEEVASVPFGAKAKVLKELVEHHLEEEEQDLFPLARELFSEEQLASLGEQMLARFEELTSAEAPAEPPEERPSAF